MQEEAYEEDEKRMDGRRKEQREEERRTRKISWRKNQNPADVQWLVKKSF